MRKKKVILVVSFGTSYDDSRERTIGAIEQAVSEAFPEYEVRRAFTSRRIIRKLKERDALVIDHVEEALARAADEGVAALVVQPTHLMSGYEYWKLAKTVEEYRDRFGKVTLADPLLMGHEDFVRTAAVLKKEVCPYIDGKTAFFYMGHGTEAESNCVYGRLQEELSRQGCDDCYIGTVEAEPSLDDLLRLIKGKKCYQKVVLKPLMVVAGDHANQDMAGEEEGSWKSRLEAEGYEVQCILHGLGESPEIQAIYVEHARTAMEREAAWEERGAVR